MRILLCPTHYVLDSEREGSEFGWAYNIADRVASSCPGSVVVVGRTGLTEPKDYRVVEVMPGTRGLVPGDFHALQFNLRYTATTVRALRAGRFGVVHHVLPFAIDRTFNLAAVFPWRSTPFVIGPVQPPLSLPDFDLASRDARGALSSWRRARLREGTAPASPPGVGFLSSRTLRRADRVVVVDSTACELALSRGVARNRIAIIPPGVDCDRFTSHEGGDAPGAPLRLLVASRLAKRKNVALVLRAFAEARRAGADAQLSVVGEGPELRRLPDEARSLGIERDVHFAGFVPHARIHERYRDADVFLNASIAEGFSTTCLEAMASGLPAVSTRVGGFSDAIRDGDNGYLVAQGDDRAMAARIVELSADRGLVRTLSQRARATALQEFDWDRVVIPRYLDLYRELVEASRSRSATRARTN
jgi:glycosyltransferase involved in cell wall biosynthesis